MAISDLKRDGNLLGIFLFLILVFSFWSLHRQNAVAAQDPPFDLVLRGGVIATMEKQPPSVEAIAFRGDRIVATRPPTTGSFSTKRT